MTIAMLLHNTVNCINLIISKPILCGVLLNGANGKLLSICSSIALVAIPSPFLHPQYEISLPLFSLYFLFLLFLHLPLVSAGSTYIASFLQLQSQIPSNSASSPFAHEKVWFHLPFNMDCTLFCPLLQCTHDMLNVFHFNAYHVRMILFYLSRKGLNAG